MNTSELQEMIDGITGAKFSGRKSRVWNLKNYIEWCESNGFPGVNAEAIRGITHQNAGKIKERTVKSPFHLQAYLNSIFAPENAETVDNVLRCYLWMAYAGIEEDDVLDISAPDVDLGLLVIRYRDEEYPIYREALAAFQNCIKLKSFAYIHPNYNSILYQERKAGDKLLRLTAPYSLTTGSVTNLHQYRQRVAQANTKAIKAGKTNIKMSYKSAFDSGLFYRVYQIESIGGKVNYQDLFDRSKYESQQSIISLAVAFRNDYENWKLTL